MYCDGRVVVTTPFYFQETAAERFMREKSSWLFSKIAFFKQFEGRVRTRPSREEYVKQKDDAYRFAVERAGYFSNLYGFQFHQINIKSQKTRWGSCSKKGNLNFNYKIALLPPHLVDYIIVHELCHLKEFNHSREFWRLVAGIIPEYLGARRELKKSEIMFV